MVLVKWRWRLIKKAVSVWPSDNGGGGAEEEEAGGLGF